MTDARHYVVADTLRDGTPILIRAVRPDDRGRLAAAFRNLDRDSIYTRFFSYKRELSDAELGQIDSLDFERHVMLVVTTPSDGDEIVIACASYIAQEREGPPVSAEVAFTVEEDYQGQGLASRMLAHLARIARDHGIARFEACVLPGNKAMLAVFARCGLPMDKRREEGEVRLTLDLRVTP